MMSEGCDVSIRRYSIVRPVPRTTLWAARECQTAAPQHKDTESPNNAVKLVCSNVNSYLLGRRRGLGQLFFPFRSCLAVVKIQMKARQVQ